MNQDMRIDGPVAPLKPAVIPSLFELCADTLIPHAIEGRENEATILAALKTALIEEKFKNLLIKKHNKDLAYIAFKAPKEYVFNPKGFNKCAYSPDGKQYAEARHGYAAITISNSITKECIKVINPSAYNPNSKQITDVAYSPDSKQLVTSFSDHVAIWNTATWECTKTVKMFQTVHMIAFSPNGKQFATGGIKNGIIELWDPVAWTVVKQIFEKDRIARIEFSPDGKQLISHVGIYIVKAWWRGEDRPLEELLQILRDKKLIKQ